MKRHRGVDCAKVQARLKANPEKLWSLNEMEKTGGKPDLVGQDAKTGEFVFYDCSRETPKGRTSVCYDREGLGARKEHKPKTSAMEMTAATGSELLTEDEYGESQGLGEFDLKTSSWLKTPAEMRKVRRCPFRRSSFRLRLLLSQRRAIVLRHQRLPLLAPRLAPRCSYRS